MNIHSLSPLPYRPFGTPDYSSNSNPSINDWFPNLSSCLDQFKSDPPPQNLSQKKPISYPVIVSQKLSSEKSISSPIKKRRRTPQKNFSFKKIYTSSWFFVPNEDDLEDCKKTVYTLLSDCTDDQARYIYKFFRDKTKNFVATGPFNRPSLVCNRVDEQIVLFVPKILFEVISNNTPKMNLRRLINIKFSSSPDNHKELLTVTYPIALKQLQRSINSR